jgi:predicted nucleic acid-binding protein
VTAVPSIIPAYFDAALVAKFYVNEPGRNSVRQLASAAGVVVTSGMAIAEVSAAFHRKLRERAIDGRVFRALHGQFAHDLDAGLWRLVWPTEALLRDVQTSFTRLASSVFARSLDALHLASARAEGFTRIYSNDRHLLAACESFGLEGVDPTR